jgi:multicomponent Na+:H+ antiporter subunit D
VPLVCLKGSAATVAAALRYMLFALLGSILYLLGAVIIYGAYGTLDITLLSGRVAPQSVAAAIAAALMTIGLLAKTALFPCTCGCRRRMPVRRLPVARCSRRSSSRALSS